jgi:hypothetical protein
MVTQFDILSAEHLFGEARNNKKKKRERRESDRTVKNVSCPRNPAAVVAPNLMGEGKPLDDRPTDAPRV